MTEPRTLNSVLAEEVDTKGIESAVALYHDLRQKYYGSGQYDFGETSLNQLSEALLAQKKDKEALAITETTTRIRCGRTICWQWPTKRTNKPTKPSPTTAEFWNCVLMMIGRRNKSVPSQVQNDGGLLEAREFAAASQLMNLEILKIETR